MSQSENAPLMSWDADQEEAQGADDFLAKVDAQDVPLACSIDNPECEACQ